MSPPQTPAPADTDMIRTILAVQAERGARIRTACVANQGTGKTPIVMADFATDVEVLERNPV